MPLVTLVTVCAGGARQQFDLPHAGAWGGSNAASCRDASCSRWDLCRISSTAGPKICPGDIGEIASETTSKLGSSSVGASCSPPACMSEEKEALSPEATMESNASAFSSVGMGSDYGWPVRRRCPAGDPGTGHGGGALGLQELVTVRPPRTRNLPSWPSPLHPGLKSCTDTAVHLALGGLGGMLDDQALHTEGMLILLQDLSLAGRTEVESRLD
ncbi:UNVERIFIED_CONTAM: hypothetical protein FKN15_044662 [Acipenser sinensis]